MTLPTEVNPLMLYNSAGLQSNIQKSLRFRSSVNAYLNRTPATTTNQTTFTFSFWVKRGVLGTSQRIASSSNSTREDFAIQFAGDSLEIYGYMGAVVVLDLITTAIYRDTSSWYHIVVAYDTTQATSTNRVKLYVNGSQATSFSTSTYPSQNTILRWNTTVDQRIGIFQNGTSSPFDGYLSEFNFIDGYPTGVTSGTWGSTNIAAIFGSYNPTTGVWQPKTYTGTYGTNGFYLPFTNTTSTATLGNDFSGNGNTWTTNNFSLTAGATYDSMYDIPPPQPSGAIVPATEPLGNYATINPNVPTVATTSTITNGNLTLSAGSTNGTRCSSLAMTSGKWYVEATLTSNPSGSDPLIGIANVTNTVINYPGATSDSYSIYCYPGNTFLQKVNNNVFTNTNTASSTTGDIIGVALDLDNNKIWFSKNGTFVDSGNPAAGTNSQFTVSAGTYYFAGRVSTNPGTCIVDFNFGQRPFNYTPPSGFVSLCSTNLPKPTIANGAGFMAATLYTGTGATQTINDGTNTTTGTTFQPDLVWIKSRSAATNNNLFDSVRSATNYVISNSSAIQATDANTLTAFGSSGFTLGSDAGSVGVNINTNTYVSWGWKAASGSSTVPTGGTVTPTGASINTTAGFSVIAFTDPNTSNYTVPHGLGVAPNLIIEKNLTGSVENWLVYHSSIGPTAALFLDTTFAAATNIAYFNNTAPTSTVFTIGAYPGSKQRIAYCWAAIPGYSAFGSYVGNNSTDGPFIYTGFRPRFFMVKSTDATTFWVIWDSTRNSYNIVNYQLYPNSNVVEQTNPDLDFVSNGVKFRSNVSTNTYIYAAFAENPFKYALAR